MSLRETLDALTPKTRVKAVDMNEEWGCTVYVRALTTGELKAIGEHPPEVRHLVEFCFGLCDESGARVYDYANDADEIGKYPLSDIIKVGNAIGDFSTVGAQIEAVKKNS